MEANCINSSPSQKLLQQYPDSSPGTRVYQYRPPLLERTCVFLGAQHHFWPLYHGSRHVPIVGRDCVEYIGKHDRLSALAVL